MHRTVVKRIITITVIFLGALFVVAQLSRFAVDTSLSKWYDGADGYQRAMMQQRATGKPIALLFHTDWCASCKKLRENVLASTHFREYLNDVIAVKINPEIGSAEQNIADHYGVMGYPTFFMLSATTKKATPIYRTQNISPEEFVDQCDQALTS